MTASPALLELLAVAGMGAALAIDTVAPQAKELHAVRAVAPAVPSSIANTRDVLRCDRRMSRASSVHVC